MIFITSDLHFFHDKEFIYKPRGFNSEQEMREYYIKIWNEKITNEDDIYILGDFCLGQDFDAIKDLILSLNGKIHLIHGNHDTDKKLELYKTLENIVEVVPVKDRFRYKDYRFYLSHYPTITSNLETNPKNCVFNLYGHIHENKKFYEERPYMMNVSMDAQDNKILCIEEVISQIEGKIEECLSYL